MKSSNFIEKILFILLFLALALFVACGSSDDENEGQTDTDTVSDEDAADDSEPSGDTDIQTDTDSDTSDTASDSDTDSDTSDTGSDSDTDSDISDTDPDADPEDETDPEFEENAKGCTMIEVPKITVGGAYSDEINGYFSPEMGENTIDIIKIMLLGELKKETYELGTGMNETYMNCKQCVMIWVDAAGGTADEYYFQTHGTLTITDVVEVEEITRTSGKIKNLILKQAEANESMSDFQLVPDGKCIAAEIVEWDTTNTSGVGGD